MSTTNLIGSQPLSTQRAIRIDRRCADEDVIIRQAMAILERRMRRSEATTAITSPETARRYLQLRLGRLEHEVFGMLWLDNKHRTLAIEELFRGTIDGASIHPREVVKSGLRANAAAAVAFHNHPSGDSTPSQADRQMTIRLKASLALVDIRLIDHIVIGETCLSMAEQGLL